MSMTPGQIHKWGRGDGMEAYIAKPASLSLGARIKFFRMRRGLSARELAEQAACGFTRGIITNIETERKTVVRSDQIEPLCRVLRVSYEALILGAEDDEVRRWSK